MVRQNTVYYFALALCIIFFTSCGYSFQGNHNPLKDIGIEKVYVAEFQNDSYRPGIEHLFTTAMIREIQKSRVFRLVSSEEDADAILQGRVTSADTAVSSTTTVKRSVSDSTPVYVAAEYSASVGCEVLLVDRRKNVIFQQSVADSKVFPAASIVDETTSPGDKRATGPLINDSEQRLAVQFLASQMMASVYQRMIDTF